MLPTPRAAAIYARISSDQDGTALGVTRQVEDCRAFAAKHGWVVAEEYIDNDISAYTGKKRPAYQRMLDDLAARERDAVIAYHLDRLTRRPVELEHFVEVAMTAKIAHVRFVAGGDFDLVSGDGLMVMRMLAAVAAGESATKSRRMKRKNDEVAAKGLPHIGGNRPFGYEDDGITIRVDEAVAVRTMVARFLAGESLGSLCVWLEEQQIRTVYDKPWRTTTLRDMMASARIAGLRAHNGVIVGPAVWDAIITVEDRARVLARIEQRRVTRERAPRSYLCSGLLRCGRCGHTLYASRRKDSRRYVCQSGPDHRGCGHLTVVADPVEQLVAVSVLYRLDTPELADALKGRAAQDEQTAALSDALAADQARLSELAEMYAAREIGRSEWVTARSAIDARVTDLERRLHRMTRNEALTGVVGNGNALRAQWADLNLSRQVAIVRAVLDHVVIAPKETTGGAFDPNRVDLVWRV